MIKTIKSTFSVLLTLGMTLCASCSSQDDIIDDIQKEVDDNQPHTCELILNVTKSGFDDEPQTRASSDNWKNGDKIYLTFTVGSGLSYGDAVYNNGTWTVNYYGSLTEGATTKCTAVYFDNPEFESSSVVMLSENTGIYEDSNGTYVFSGGTLSVVANLSPKTGRMRFAGSNNDEIIVYGITHYTSYDCSNGKFTNSMGAINTKVSSNYTPYVYGSFSDNEQPRLNIITSTSGYTRLLSTSIYKKGESGYMDIPTETSHNGWLNSVIFKVNGVEFTMIPVLKESGNYLMSETEITNALYDAIMGTSSSYPQRPVVGKKPYSSFLTNLNAITELSFDVPTFSEWNYAAKGGNKSQNYTFSGSNIVSNVAWYSGNSGGSLHDVKQLQPNELGFYDMTGNASEYVSNDYWVGGCYSSSESECMIRTTTYDTGSSSYCGLRMILRMSNN